VQQEGSGLDEREVMRLIEEKKLFEWSAETARAILEREQHE